MLKFFEKRRARRDAARHADGFAYAAAFLLRCGPSGIVELEGDISAMKDWGDYDKFEEGVEEAIAQFKSLMK